MYHYLKWAALSLFFRRNLRYILYIFVAVIGIYGVNGIYRDLADYAIATEQKSLILYLLLGKWMLVITLSILLVYAVMHLGFSKEDLYGRSKEKKREKRGKPQEADPVLQRLEKFKTKKRLRRRSDLVLEKLEKEKRKK